MTKTDHNFEDILAHAREYLLAGDVQSALAEIDRVDGQYGLSTDSCLLRGITLLRMRRAEDAIASLDIALSIDPDNLLAQLNRADAYNLSGAYDDALTDLNSVLAAHPELDEVRLRRATLRMRLGDLRSGLSDYKARHAVHGRRVGLAMEDGDWPQWTGAPLAGKRIALAAEQGLGDSVQIVRFAHMISALGADVVLGIQASLHTLVRQSGFTGEIYDRVPSHVTADYQAALMDVPLILNLHPSQLWTGAPYLKADIGERISRSRALRLARLSVGIAWQGDPSFFADDQRSIPLSAFEWLAGIDGVSLYSVQARDGLGQLADNQSRLGMTVFNDLDDGPSSFCDSAALMASLDIIITPDTAIGHVAGALGRPVWLALSRQADYRWMEDRTDTPWYPNHRLYRQSKSGDWSDVMRRMQADIFTELETK